MASVAILLHHERPEARALAIESPRLARLATGGGDRDLFKARLFGRLLAGRRVVDLDQVVSDYAAHVTARTVQLKVRFGDFRTITRSRTLSSAPPMMITVPSATDRSSPS